MFNRRAFLQQSLAVVSLGVAVPPVFARAVAAASEQSNLASVSGKTLVVIQLAGGVDGLNTVVPYHDPIYRQNRTALGIKETDLLPIDDRTALHGSLPKLRYALATCNLAIVEGVRYPNPNFSHFKA